MSRTKKKLRWNPKSNCWGLLL